MGNGHIDGKPILHEGEVMQIPAQLTLRDEPEVLAKYKWTYRAKGLHAGANTHTTEATWLLQSSIKS